MIVHWYDEELTCDKAVQNVDSVELYDNDDNLINKIEQISSDEWAHISLEGGVWTSKEFIRSTEDKLREENTVLRADLDYCLMLLEGL